MGMTSNRAGAIGMTGGRTGALGGEDSSGKAEGNMMVGDGFGLVRGVTKDGKAAKDDEGSEIFRGRL